jgi:hypothetical protein
VPISELITKDVSAEDLSAFGPAPAAASAPGDKPLQRTGWPYSNVLYLSAASKMEKAIDIGRRILREHPTVDGQPHGAMTNQLLGGLSGLADTNNDGSLTYEELGRYTSQRVEHEFNHKPQFESPGATYSGAPLFGQVRSPRAVERAQAGVTRLRLDGVAEAFAFKAARLAGVQLTKDAFDLLVRPSAEGGLDLFHSSYDRIQRYAPGEEAELLRRIEQHGQAWQLLNLRFAQQRFNVSLQLRRADGAAGEAEFYMGDKVQMMVTAERPCYVVAVNIDTAGDATLLHAGLGPLAANQPAVVGPRLEVGGPLGTEYVKLVAFEAKPEGLDAWAKRIGVRVSPGSEEFRQLISFLGAGEGSQYSTKLVTTRRP